jgi:hypothetical protein
VACGEDHSAAATADGALWTWGAGARGQLGHGGRGARYIPCRVPAIADGDGGGGVGGGGGDGGWLGRVRQVSCGRQYTMAVADPEQGPAGGAELVAFGRNDADQLGLGQAAEVWAWVRRLGSASGWLPPLAAAAAAAAEAPAAAAAPLRLRGAGGPATAATIAEDLVRALAAEGLDGWGRLARAPAAALRRACDAAKASPADRATLDAALAGLRAAAAAAASRPGGADAEVAAAEAAAEAAAAAAGWYGANVRRAGSRLRWEYSGWDALGPVRVPQGLFVSRDGKVGGGRGGGDE